MVSNKVKRNIWLALTVVSVACVIARAIRVAEGAIEWWDLISTIIITAFCVKFYLCYRRAVREGKLFGRVDLFSKRTKTE